MSRNAIEKHPAEYREETRAAREPHVAKREFDIDKALARIEDAVEPFPKAALFELAEEGFLSPFEQLVACIISIRTRDEMTLPIARRLFEAARTPAQVLALPVKELEKRIHGCAFYDAKARQIREIAHRVVNDHGGELPCESDVLQSFPGVGPKCANLVLGIACEQAQIGVDIHVHRITNRWGYVAAPTPELTMGALEKKLPRQHWLTINRLLVPFGKHICTGTLPKCSICAVLDMCGQVGVTAHR
jgi:endonuclease-3